MDKITKVTVNGSTYQLGGNPDVSGFYKITVTLPTAPNSSTLSYDGYTFPIGAVVRVQDSNSDSGYAFYRLHDITNGIAVWSKLDGGLLIAPETVTVHVASNQATDTDLVGVATVTVNGETQTYNGSDLVFYVEEGTSYTINAGSVSGYAISNDSTSTYTAVFMGSRTANITYNTEVVTVTTEMNGATLTIDGNTYTEPVKIPYGTTYVVTGSAITGYKASSNTITASQASRTVTVTYREAVSGIFAIKSDGTEVSYSDADNSCVGVVVRDVENDVAFFIDKRFPTESGSSASASRGNYKAWSSALYLTDQSYLTNIDGSGAANTSIQAAANDTLRTNALNAYANGETGVANTDNICNDSLCSSEDAVNNAAKYCRSIQNPVTGAYDGYLGSVYEWIVVNDNQVAINQMLSRIGGVQFAGTNSGFTSRGTSSAYYWTSSERTSQSVWLWYWVSAFVFPYFQSNNKNDQGQYGCARPFFPLN